MKRKYYTIADRKTLIYYLYWEYGYYYTAKNLKEIERYGKQYIVPDTFFQCNHKKSRSDNFAKHVQTASAYICGKLGKGLYGGHVQVVKC